jgi:hypothetical protein
MSTAAEDAEDGMQNYQDIDPAAGLASAFTTLAAA